jgi:hypothetical protein
VPAVGVMELNFDYASCIKNSEKVAWRIEDVLAADAQLDYGRPFLPSALSGESGVPSLSASEGRRLNQITGYAYLNLFAFVEEYIIDAAMRQAADEVHGDHVALRALLRFSEEEVKHQEMFHRAIALLSRSFGTEVDVLGDAAAVAGVILSKDPLAVMLVTLHLELMTQEHYTESVRDDAAIDPLFRSMLKHHWIEEAQHARIDALEVAKLANQATPEQIAKAFDDYVDLIGAFDGLLGMQAKMDVENLRRATGVELDAAAVEAAQYAAYRNTFLLMGMRNRQFVEYTNKVSAEGAKKIAAKAATLA